MGTRSGHPVDWSSACTSRSCPPLRNEPYDAAKLDAQLDEETRSYVNSPNGVKPSGDGAALSKIFDWYKEDFGGEAAGHLEHRVALVEHRDHDRELEAGRQAIDAELPRRRNLRPCRPISSTH